MVFLDPEALKWRPYVLTWLQSKFSEQLSDTLKVQRFCPIPGRVISAIMYIHVCGHCSIDDVVIPRHAYEADRVIKLSSCRLSYLYIQTQDS